MRIPEVPHQGPRARELDFIRGIAILLVMGYHFLTIPTGVWIYRALEFPGKSFGASGVDMFFVLSGFLVGGLLAKEYKKTGGLAVKRFILRRGLKIWPAYYLLILVEIVDHHHPYKSFVWQNLFHLQNYAGTSISHTWTLSLEEHFYLVLAVLMGWMARKEWSARRMLQTFLMIMGAVLVIRTITVLAGWPGSTEYTHDRLDSLLAGVCLAVIFHFYPEHFERLARYRWPLAIMTAIAVAFMIFVHSPLLRHTIGFTIVYVGYSAFLILVYKHSAAIRDWKLYRLTALIGVYSYGIYLWHNSVRYPSLSLAMKLPRAAQWPVLMMCQYLGAIVLGIVTTQLVEWPFLRLRNRILPQKVADIGTPAAGAAEAVDNEPLAEPAKP